MSAVLVVLLAGAATILNEYPRLRWLWIVLIVAGALLAALLSVRQTPWWQHRQARVVARQEHERRQAVDRDEHFEPRGRGVAQPDWRGQYFTGRTRVLGELAAWLAAPSTAGDKLRVVTGGPGAGKSAVLGRLVALADPSHRVEILKTIPHGGTVPPKNPIDVSVHARGRSLDQVLAAISGATGVEVTSAEALLLSLQDRPRPLVVVVDAVDEALQPDQLIEQLLRPLATSEPHVGVRLLVGARPHLLSALGVSNEALLDLDATGYFDPTDLVAYVRRCLLLEGNPVESSPYRARPEVASEVAQAVAMRADHSFLVAQLTARALARDPEVVDTSRAGWMERFPDSVAGAMRAYLSRFAEDERRRVRDLLVPLGFAEGAGVPEDLWAELSSELGTDDYRSQDVRWLVRDTPASDLLQAVDQDGERVYRLFHAALAEYLRSQAGNPEREVQRQYASTLIERVPMLPSGEKDWVRADRYTKGHLASHAAAAEVLDDLLDQPSFLLVADPSRLVAALSAATSQAARTTANVYRSVVHQLRGRQLEEAASYLELHARQLGASDLADRVARLGLTRPWSVPWVFWLAVHANRVLGRHNGEVSALAVAELDGRPVVVAGGSDGAVRVWEPAAGVLVGELLNRDNGKVSALAVAELDGAAVVVVACQDGDLRVVDLASGTPVRSLPNQDGPVWTVARAELNGRPVLVSGHDGGAVQLWDLATGAPRDEPIYYHEDGVTAVTTAKFEDETVGVSSGLDGGISIWELDTGETVGGPFRGHDGWINTLITAKLNSRAVIISGGGDGTIRLWESAIGIPPSDDAPAGFELGVEKLAVAELGGRSVVVAGGDGFMKLWDLATGAPLDKRPPAYYRGLYEIKTSEIDGHPVIVSSGGAGGELQVWDLATDTVISKPLSDSKVFTQVLTVAELHGQPVLVSSSFFGHEILICDLASGTILHRWRTDDTTEVAALAVVDLDGQPVVIAGGRTGNLSVMEPSTGALLSNLPTRDRSAILALVVAKLDGRPMVVSGNQHGKVQIWDLVAHELISESVDHHEGKMRALAIAGPDDRPVVVSGGEDGTVRIWNPTRGLERTIEVGARVTSMAVAPPWKIVVGTSMGFLVLSLPVPNLTTVPATR